MGQGTKGLVMALFFAGCTHVPTPPVPPPAPPQPDPEVEELRADNAALADRVAELEAELLTCASDSTAAIALERCALQRGDLRAQLSRTSARLTEAKQQLADLGRRPPVAAHEASLVRIEELEAALLAQPSPDDLALARQRVIDLEHALAEAPTREEFERVRDRAQRLRQKLDGAQTDLAHYAGLDEQLDRMQARFNVAHDRADILERSNDDLKLKVDNQRERIQRLKQRLTEARDRIDALEGKDVVASPRPRPPR